jgi:hypothetical protein
MKACAIFCGFYSTIGKPDRYLLVLNGDKYFNVALSLSPAVPENLESSENGNCSVHTGGTNRALAAAYSALAINPVCHHFCHRITVRLGASGAAVLVAGRSPRSGAGVSATGSGFARTHASTTTAATYTRRPKNRTDIGV